MGEVSVKEGIAEYKEIYLPYRNFSQRTRIEYLNDLQDLGEFLGQMNIHYVGEITLPHLIRYLAELEKRGFAGSTRKRKVISIRSYIGFLHLQGYFLSDIGKRLLPPRVDVAEPRHLSMDECKFLLDSAKPNKRDYAIIQLLLATGMKLSELTRLMLNDLHIANFQTRTNAKVDYIWISGNRKGKGRVIPLSPEASLAIANYMAVRGNSTCDCLFLNKLGNALGKRGVEKIIEKYLAMVGIKNASVNSLRHTFAAQLAAKGKDKTILRLVMGIKDEKTTGRYYSFLNNQIR